MDTEKQARLEAKGWKFGDAAEFLGLSPEEQAIIDMRLALAQNLRDERISQGIQQAELAIKVKTTQNRVSLMENGDKSISLDKLFAANIALGVQPIDLLQRVSATLSGTYIDHRPKRRVPSSKHRTK